MISAERWERIRVVFEEVRSLDDDRTGALARLCGADDDLRDVVRRMLDADGRNVGIEELIADAAATDDPAPADEVSIDRYRIIRRIGAGGMGVVYLAERADDTFQKRVAIKVIKPGMASNEVIDRFKRERQLLAAVDHPSVARLLDGGVTDDGRPYLVMEFVDGEPIDQYCDRHRLTLEGRARLFTQVCAAVERAHRNRIVHRDLKPGNILVTTEGEPKLLDFGIARLLQGPASGDTVTATHHRVFTPRYASPEQITGGEVTAASDVYSLGVILYELLCGQRPPPQVTTDGSSAVVTATIAPPSRALKRLSNDTGDGTGTAVNVAAARGINAASLRRRLAGDLDLVVMAALRPKPRERYPSVMKLAADLDAALRGTAVSVRPDSFGWRFKTTVLRHRWTIGLAVIALAAATMATVATVTGQRETHRADAAAADALERVETATRELEQRDADLRVSHARVAAADRRSRLLAVRDGAWERADAERQLLAIDRAHRGWAWEHLWRVTRPERWHHARTGVGRPEIAVTASNLVVVAWSSGQFDVVDGATGGLVGSWRMPGSVGQMKIAAAPRDDVVAASAPDRTIQLISIPSGELLSVLETPLEQPADAICWHPDGDRIALAGRDQVYVIESGDGSVVASGRPTPGIVDQGRFEWSPEGEVILVGSAERPGRVVLWDPMTDQAEPLLPGNDTRITGARFSPDGAVVVTTDAPMLVVVDRARGTEHRRTLPVLSRQVDFAADGSLVGTLIDGRRYKIDLGASGADITLGPTRILPGRVAFRGWGSSITMSPDRRISYLGAVDGAYAFEDRRRAIAPGRDVSTGRGAIVSADARQIIGVFGTGAPGRVIDTVTGTSRPDLPAATAIAQTNDARTLVLGTTLADRYDVVMWDLEGMTEIARFAGHHAGIVDIAIAPTHPIAASAARDDTLRAWNLVTRRLRRAWSVEGVRRVAIDMSGDRIVSASRLGDVKLWHIDDVETVRSIGSHAGGCLAIAFNETGTLFASAGLDGIVRVYDTVAFDAIGAFDVERPVADIAFSPAGDRLLVAPVRGGTIDFYDTETFEPVFALRCDWVHRIRFDGNTLVASCQDGTIRVWQADRTLPDD